MFSPDMTTDMPLCRLVSCLKRSTATAVFLKVMRATAMFLGRTQTCVSNLLLRVAFWVIRDLETVVPNRQPRQPCGNQTHRALDLHQKSLSAHSLMHNLGYCFCTALGSKVASTVECGCKKHNRRCITCTYSQTAFCLSLWWSDTDTFDTLVLSNCSCYKQRQSEA